MSNSRRIDPAAIVDTLELLRRRIEERFPESGLLRICGDLCDLSKESILRTNAIRSPIPSLRIGVGLLLVLIVTLLGSLPFVLRWERVNEVSSVTRFVEIFESSLWQKIMILNQGMVVSDK